MCSNPVIIAQKATFEAPQNLQTHIEMIQSHNVIFDIQAQTFDGMTISRHLHSDFGQNGSISAQGVWKFGFTFHGRF